MAREIDRDEVQRLMAQGAQVVDVLPAREYGEDRPDIRDWTWPAPSFFYPKLYHGAERIQPWRRAQCLSAKALPRGSTDPVGEDPRGGCRNAEDRNERSDLVDQRNAACVTPTAALRIEAASHTQMKRAAPSCRVFPIRPAPK